MKERVRVVLIILGLFGIQACRSSESDTSASNVDQSSANSIEAITAVQDNISATQTQVASAAAEAPTSTNSPSPSRTATLAPTLAASATPTTPPTVTPIPSPIPAIYPFPFNQPLPIQWEGKGFNKDADQLFVIDKIWTGGRFSGNFHYPGNKAGEDVGSLLTGIIVESISEYELAKWEKIEDFGEEPGSTWIRFSEQALSPPNDDDNGQYLATINGEGEMRGLYYWNHHTFEPFHTIEFSLID